MTDFGVTDAGFIPKTQQDILGEIEAQQHATIDPALDVSPEQPLGLINGIFSRALAEIQELIRVAYDAFDPDKAEGDRLVSLCKLTGTEKNGATFSTVLVNVDLEAGTTLVAGTHFVQVTGNPAIRFTPVNGVDGSEVPIATTLSMPFRAENPGPVVAVAGTLTTIATPVSGWTSATNPNPATLGFPVDTNETLRERREKALQATGSATVGAIRSDVLELRDDDDAQFVQSCTVFENTTDSVDANGLPPHSFEVLVYDGESPPPSQDDAIAQVIWDDRPAGIRSFGDQLGSAVDELGASHDVTFSRATRVQIYVELSLTTGPGYVGDATVKNIIATFANQKFKEPGMDVIALYVRALALGAGGVTDVPTFAIGRSPGPTLDNNVPIGIRELARFEIGNIAIV